MNAMMQRSLGTKLQNERKRDFKLVGVTQLRELKGKPGEEVSLVVILLDIYILG
jgi:hypothetical protein